MKLTLASASPRRKEIIAYLKIPFSIHAADVDESPRAGESPAALVSRLSRAKALAVARAHASEDELVLAADTIVALDGEVLGKPASADEAAAFLRRLRGRAHQVFTGLTLAQANDTRRAWSGLCETLVHMRDYSDDELRAYIASGSPFDKAGAYAIQDADFHPVEKIVGCYLNVMGLPLCEVIDGLQALGWSIEASEPIRHDCLAARGQPCWA